ncbi:hypothetical protein B0F90DRAFT_1747231 [Multifurca ochricompacta]|uniref:C2H2-type domain-containing protein n=1 Tax=Multifurca ochricompacta TaxID=376703 RepID=A0AAD4LZ28_9AGAM|nr:hypothetical protein B0F90DRAFT_1747231 [Multifurca ochricompacta]
MSVSPVLAATTVYKPQDSPNPLVLHLSGVSGASESEYEPVVKPVASSSRQPLIRPFVCTTCNKSYLRETHLQAHVRSHLSKSDRPFHLKAHKEAIHYGEKPFKCSHEGCGAAFLKHHKLRVHMASEHALPGTKPHQCDHGDCTKSFSTKQKLRAHLKVHEEKRYTCVNLICRAAPELAFYQTWTALQHHIRTAHPPTCPHEECAGRTFSAQRNLRAHLKVHDQRMIEEELEEHEWGSWEDEDDTPPRKRRRRGVEVGRDWECEMEGCAKDFKSKKALMTHHAITHLGRRDFVCAMEGCERAFGYKHILQRHQVRVHGNSRAETEDDEDGGELHVDADEESSKAERPRPQKRKTRHGPPACTSIIDEITGVAYTENATKTKALLKCPHPDMNDLPPAVLAESVRMWGDETPCEYVFGRAYDLRRHLRAVHGVVLEKEVMDRWARTHRE